MNPLTLQFFMSIWKGTKKNRCTIQMQNGKMEGRQKAIPKGPVDLPFAIILMPRKVRKKKRRTQVRHNVIQPCVSYSHGQPCISYKHVIVYVYLKSALKVKYAQPTLTAQRPSNSESCSSDWSTIFFDLMLKAVSVPSPLKQQQQQRATVVRGVDYSYYALQSGGGDSSVVRAPDS